MRCQSIIENLNYHYFSGKSGNDLLWSLRGSCGSLCDCRSHGMGWIQGYQIVTYFNYKKVESIFVGPGLSYNLWFDAAICSHFRRSSHSRPSVTPKNRIQNFCYWNCTWSGMTYFPEHGDWKRKKVTKKICVSHVLMYFSFFLPIQKKPFFLSSLDLLNKTVGRCLEKDDGQASR